MRSKITFVFIIACLSVLFAQETVVCSWNVETDYVEGDVVLYEGMRYIANVSNKGTSPVNGGIDIWRSLYGNNYVNNAQATRVGPISHIRMSYMLSDDYFVNYYGEKYLPFKFRELRDVGVSNEKFRVGEYLHSAWSNFMVVSGKTYLKDRTSRDTKNYREYLRYADTIKAKGSEVKAGTDKNSSLEEAFEQIIHNIGDAGVAFGHALSDYLGISGSSSHDAREYGHEYAISDYINNPFILDIIPVNKDNREYLMTTYFLGTIYDAIDTYEKRVLTAVKWGNEKIPTPTPGSSCYADYTWEAAKGLKGVECLGAYSYSFGVLTHGNGETIYNGEPVYGVTRSALAVGRFIMVDAILATQPLTDMKITSTKTNIGLEAGAKCDLAAFAKDPDAIRFEIKEGKKDDGDPDSYRTQYDRNAHKMFYQWQFIDKDNKIVYFPENKNNEDNSLTITVIDSSRLSGEKDKRNGAFSVKISNKTKSLDLDTAIIVKNSQFQVKVRFEDDEGDTAFATKSISVFNRIPEPNFEFHQNGKNVEKPYITLIQRKDFGEYTQSNGYKVHSGYGNPKCIRDLYINAFSSFDPDGNASDQITKIEFKVNGGNNFEKILLGINQQDSIENKNDGFDGYEYRYVVNSSFRLMGKEDRKTKGESKTYYLSSTWNNFNSPVIDSVAPYYNLKPDRNHKIVYKITDDENASIVDTTKIAVLTPPKIDSVEIGTKNLCNGQSQKHSGTTNTSLTMSGNSQEMAIYFKASATDEDGGNVAYGWGFKNKNNSSNSISLTNPEWENHIYGSETERTYQELKSIGLSSGIVYEVILKVIDDDKSITGLENGSGITIMKAGEIVLQ